MVLSSGLSRKGKKEAGSYPARSGENVGFSIPQLLNYCKVEKMKKITPCYTRSYLAVR
jgi:hypothetical protein